MNQKERKGDRKERIIKPIPIRVNRIIKLQIETITDQIKRMIILKKIRNLNFIVIVFLLIQACQSDMIYSEYVSIEKNEWRNKQILKFEIPMQDTINSYNLYINLRNTKEYSYSNLFLLTQMTFPDKSKVIDTLEYEMTDAEGHFLGSGFSEIKENKLFYKKNVRFQELGTYLFQIKQAMRNRNEIEGINPLLGVSDVGISIEKIE